VLHSFEIIGAGLLTVHAVLIMIVKEHSRRVSFLQFLVKFTKYSIPFYIGIIIIRVGVFFHIMRLINEINTKKEGGFGAFLAPFLVGSSRVAAITLTIIILWAYIGCFVIQYVTVKLSHRIEGNLE